MIFVQEEAPVNIPDHIQVDKHLGHILPSQILHHLHPRPSHSHPRTPHHCPLHRL